MEKLFSTVIYDNPLPQLRSRQSAFPGLCILPDGKILASHQIGEAFESVDGTTYVSVSTDGGNLYIGIDDDGNAVEANNIDGVMLQVSNVIRDAIKPDLAMFCDITVETVQNKKVVKITVNRGTARPYYLAAKGIRPEVYM